MISVTVDTSIYSIDVVLRACHAFSGRCFATPRVNGDRTITVELTPRDAADEANVAGEFSNALTDYRLRELIATETQPVRELLVAQAFCEGGLLDRGDTESDEYDDPRGIVQ